MKVADAMAAGNIPALIPMLAMYTGDEKWLRPPYAPGRQKGLDDNHDGGLPPEIQAEIRAAAAEAVASGDSTHATSHARAARADAQRRHGRGGAARVRADDRRPARPGPATAGARGGARRASARSSSAPASRGWRRRSSWPRRASRTSCSSATRPSAARGWRTDYPGAGVDTPNQLYSFSFAPYDWSMYFALRDELHAYLEQLADEFGVRERSASAPRCRRRRTTRTPRTGCRDRRRAGRCAANVVISAVGGFNKPKCPDVDLGPLRRPVVHTARWPQDLDLTGKRVGVIGNGASAMQLGPGGLRGGGACHHLPALAALGGAVRPVPRAGARADALAAAQGAALPPLVPAAVRLDVQRPDPPGAAEGPGVGAPGALAQRGSTTATASTSPSTSSPELGDRPDLLDEGGARPTRRSASAC